MVTTRFSGNELALLSFEEETQRRLFLVLRLPLNLIKANTSWSTLSYLNLKKDHFVTTEEVLVRVRALADDQKKTAC